jgi:hypothetical protein
MDGAAAALGAGLGGGAEGSGAGGGAAAAVCAGAGGLGCGGGACGLGCCCGGEAAIAIPGPERRTMLGTGALGGISTGAGGAAVGGGAEGVCAEAVLAKAADLSGRERADLAAVCFGGFRCGAAASSGVARAAGSGFALATRCDLGLDFDADCRSVVGFGCCVSGAPCAFGGCSVKGRWAGGAAAPEFSVRSKPGNVWGGPRESMTLSLTTTSGVAGGPKITVCAAAGSADAARSAPVTIAARQEVSRSEADAEYLPIPEPRFFPDGRHARSPSSRSKYRARGQPATARFRARDQALPAPFMASLRSAASGRCR